MCNKVFSKILNKLEDPTNGLLVSVSDICELLARTSDSGDILAKKLYFYTWKEKSENTKL